MVKRKDADPSVRHDSTEIPSVLLPDVLMDQRHHVCQGEEMQETIQAGTTLIKEFSTLPGAFSLVSESYVPGPAKLDQQQSPQIEINRQQKEAGDLESIRERNKKAF